MEKKYCFWNNPVDPRGYQNPCPQNKKYLCCNFCNSKTCEWRCNDDHSQCKYLTDVNKSEPVKQAKVEVVVKKKQEVKSVPEDLIKDKIERDRLARKARREARKARKKLEGLYNK